MIVQYILLGIMGLSFGALAAGGVFTVLSAVGLVPRFCQRTDTRAYILTFENMIILGSIIGTMISIWERKFYIYPYLSKIESISPILYLTTEYILNIVYGLFSGVFVGCLALAIAEMLDSIPIFTKRIGFKKGLSIIIVAMAVGKICGSIFYFIFQIEG